MNRFNVTFEIVTEESAQDGEAAESGFISENVSLSCAVADVKSTFTNTCDGGSADYGDRWITVNNGMDYITGECESRSLHRPAKCTNASWNRICRIVCN